MNIDDLVWDKDTYGRQSTKTSTVDAYKASLEAGATFPPIKVERLKNYPGHEGEVISIRDGWHRWQAYKKAEVKEIEVEFWTDEILDYADPDVRSELLLASSHFNTEHGDRVTEGDKQRSARAVAEGDPEGHFSEEYIASRLAVSQSTVSKWISDIIAKRKADRNAIIYRLSRLGWTQERIGEAVGLGERQIRNVTGNSAEIDKIAGYVHRNVPPDRVDALVEQAAQEYHLDIPLAWSIRMDGLSDSDRFGLAPSNDNAQNLKWGPYPYDVWNFSQCDTRFGDMWPGRIPAQVVGHVLYFYTNQGDLVMDPMAGGGVVPDVCLALNRKCRAFDIVPGSSPFRTHKRPEIEEWSWMPVGMQWPDVHPDLIFFDPPYFDKKDEEYSTGAGNGISISSFSQDSYLDFFARWFALARENIKPGGILAFLMSDWNDEDTGTGIFLWDYANLLLSTGWRIVRHIQVPLSTQSVHGDFVNKFRETRRLARLERYLLVATTGR